MFKSKNTTEDIISIRRRMDLYVKSLTDLIEMIYTPDMTIDQCRQKMYDLTPDFRNDKIFNNLFPSIFGIVSGNKKLAGEPIHNN